jgi:hypothetical protein
MAKVEQVDAGFTAVRQWWLPFPRRDAGKGMEGLACVSRDGRTNLLAIARATAERAERRAVGRAGGRVQVFGAESDS